MVSSVVSVLLGRKTENYAKISLILLIWEMIFGILIIQKVSCKEIIPFPTIIQFKIKR